MWYIHYWKAPCWTCSPPEVLLSRVVLAWVRSQFSEGESFKQWHGDFQIRLQDENMSNVTLCMCADRLLLSYMERSNIPTVWLCSDWHTTVPYILCAVLCQKMQCTAVHWDRSCIPKCNVLSLTFCFQCDERASDIKSFQPQNIYFLTWAAKRTYFKRFFKILNYGCSLPPQKTKQKKSFG